MKKLGKKVINHKESIEAYASKCSACGCSCSSCWCTYYSISSSTSTSIYSSGYSSDAANDNYSK